MSLEWITPVVTLAKDLGQVFATRKKHREVLTRLRKQNNRLRDEVRQLRKTLAKGPVAQDEDPGLRFAGWYLAGAGQPSLMNAISSTLESFRERTAPGVLVASDFAAYGAVTWRAEFVRQQAILLALTKDGAHANRRPRMVFNSESTNREILDRQFPASKWDEYRRTRSAELLGWFGDSEVGTALVLGKGELEPSLEPEELSKIKRGDKPVSRETFVECFLAYNEYVVRQYLDGGAIVFRYGSTVPIHAWLASKNGEGVEGIFGFSDAEAVWNEPGFYVSAEVASVVGNLVNDICDRAERAH